jgi:hypothetical protein
MKIAAAIFLAMVFSMMYVQAWVIRFCEQPNLGGKYEEFHSAFADNGCYNLEQSVIDVGIQSFKYCTDWIHHCSITLHSETGCTGYLLDSTDADQTLTKMQTTSAERKVKSFRMQGCATGLTILGIPAVDERFIDQC